LNGRAREILPRKLKLGGIPLKRDKDRMANGYFH
jgi:hypothetical protein